MEAILHRGLLESLQTAVINSWALGPIYETYAYPTRFRGSRMLVIRHRLIACLSVGNMPGVMHALCLLPMEKQTISSFEGTEIHIHYNVHKKATSGKTRNTNSFNCHSPESHLDLQRLATGIRCIFLPLFLFLIVVFLCIQGGPKK